VFWEPKASQQILFYHPADTCSGCGRIDSPRPPPLSPSPDLGRVYPTPNHRPRSRHERRVRAFAPSPCFTLRAAQGTRKTPTAPSAKSAVIFRPIITGTRHPFFSLPPPWSHVPFLCTLPASPVRSFHRQQAPRLPCLSFCCPTFILDLDYP
jgi:hypothetical protein